MNEFIKVKTAELHGAALDWAVAKATQAEELKVTGSGRVSCIYELAHREGCWTNDYCPSTEWSEGGLLIQAQRISLSGPGCMGGQWSAHIDTGSFGGSRYWFGETALMAACRALVGTMTGDSVSVPAELAP